MFTKNSKLMEHIISTYYQLCMFKNKTDLYLRIYLDRKVGLSISQRAKRISRSGTIKFNKVLLYCIVLYRIVSYCIVLYCIVLYCIVLYCIVLYCIVLYCIVLYCIVLYCIVLYCIVLYCVVLYCIVLYCTAS